MNRCRACTIFSCNDSGIVTMVCLAGTNSRARSRRSSLPFRPSALIPPRSRRSIFILYISKDLGFMGLVSEKKHSCSPRSLNRLTVVRANSIPSCNNGSSSFVSARNFRKVRLWGRFSGWYSAVWTSAKKRLSCMLEYWRNCVHIENLHHLGEFFPESFPDQLPHRDKVLHHGLTLLTGNDHIES